MVLYILEFRGSSEVRELPDLAYERLEVPQCAKTGRAPCPQYTPAMSRKPGETTSSIVQYFLN